jgi:Oxidoreductase FAD-binding domain
MADWDGPRRPLELAPHFQRLTVAGPHRTTEDATAVTFESSKSFRTFIPGQYLTLRATIDGQDVRRCYSICPGLDDGTLRVGITHLPGGLFSTRYNTIRKQLNPLQIMRPEGRFGIAIDPAVDLGDRFRVWFHGRRNLNAGGERVLKISASAPNSACVMRARPSVTVGAVGADHADNWSTKG